MSSSCSRLTCLGALLADPEQSLREAWTLNSRILEELLSLASNATKLKKLQSQTHDRAQELCGFFVAFDFCTEDIGDFELAKMIISWQDVI